jgi:hypothetical protein
MKKPIRTYVSIPNIIVFILIICEIAYIALSKLKYSEYNVKHIIGHFGWYKIQFMIFMVTGILLLTLIISLWLNINGLLSLIFIVLTYFLYLEYKLNHRDELLMNISTLANKDEMNTGDYIMMETPKNMDSYIQFSPVMSMGIYHVGIIVKDTNQKVYIMESEHIPHYCEYSKKTKTGVILSSFEKRIQEFETVYIVKNNIHEHVSNNDMMSFIEKYKDVEYMENDINCIVFLLVFLKEHGLLKHEEITKRLYVEYPYILDNANYTIDFDYTILKI